MSRPYDENFRAIMDALTEMYNSMSDNLFHLDQENAELLSRVAELEAELEMMRDKYT